MSIILTSLNAKYIHTNLALRYLKAYSMDEFDTEIVEYTIKDPVLNIASDLYRKKPEIIAFSCYIWNIEQTIEVIEMIKKVDPTITILIGGPEVSYDIPYWLERIEHLDFLLYGEGEATFKHFLQVYYGDKNFKKVNGIAYRSEENRNVINPPREKLDLSTLPSPYRFKEDIPHLSKRISYIETSRGCPFNCQFCLSSIEVGVRYFKREQIKEDIRYLMENGAKIIKFVDRTFNISRSYAMEMFQFLIDEHKEGTVFQFEITADIMRPEVIAFLNEKAPKGLFRFEIGVQSTNDDTNELVKRRQNFEKLTRTVTMVKEGGKIDQHLDLIAGLPEEDYDSFKQTFNDVFAMRPEELQLGFLKLLRGTGLRIEAKKYGYVSMDKAPYEILGNRVLSFAEMIRIKNVEDILEKYWNDHRMDYTMEYLVTTVFPTPFDFFQEFGDYWESNGWSRIGHQLEDLFTRLHSFIATYYKEQLDKVEGYLLQDYYRHHKYKPRKIWWNDHLQKEQRNAIYKQVLNDPTLFGKEFESLSLHEKDLYKHTLLDLLVDQNDNKLLLLTYFDPQNLKPYFYKAPISAANITA